MKLDEIARKITGYLKKFENDPGINITSKYGTTRYYQSCAFKCGRFVAIRYVSYHPHSPLSKTDALAYLAWLEAGNVGKHWDIKKDD